jgi:hypothetical protein
MRKNCCRWRGCPYLNLRTLFYDNTCISTIHHADGRVSDMGIHASGLVIHASGLV